MVEKTEAIVTSEPRSDAQIRKQFLGIVHKTNKDKPRPADLEELRKMLSKHQVLQLWRMISGIAEAAELTMLAQASFVTPVLRECWSKRLKQLRLDLGYKDAPEVEQLLISHVALCWLRLHLVEHGYSSNTSGEHTFKLGLYWEKRLTSAQRRYTRAVETLAKVRALTAATRLIESRTEAASAAKRVNNVRLLNAMTGTHG
jgi:hypothetical protein